MAPSPTSSSRPSPLLSMAILVLVYYHRKIINLPLLPLRPLPLSSMAIMSILILVLSLFPHSIPMLSLCTPPLITDDYDIILSRQSHYRLLTIFPYFLSATFPYHQWLSSYQFPIVVKSLMVPYFLSTPLPPIIDSYPHVDLPLCKIISLLLLFLHPPLPIVVVVMSFPHSVPLLHLYPPPSTVDRYDIIPSHQPIDVPSRCSLASSLLASPYCQWLSSRQLLLLQNYQLSHIYSPPPFPLPPSVLILFLNTGFLLSFSYSVFLFPFRHYPPYHQWLSSR